MSQNCFQDMFHPDMSIRTFLENRSYLWDDEKAIENFMVEPVVREDLIRISEFMLTVNPIKRPTAKELLDSDFFKTNLPMPCTPEELMTHIPAEPALNERLIKENNKRGKQSKFFLNQECYNK